MSTWTGRSATGVSPSEMRTRASSVTRPMTVEERVPFVEEGFERRQVFGGRDDQHALLGLGEHDLVGGHSLLAPEHLGDVDLDAGAARAPRTRRPTPRARQRPGPACRRWPPGCCSTASRHASMSTFSRKGLATCTAERSSLSSWKVREARPEAPWDAVPARVGAHEHQEVADARGPGLDDPVAGQ